MPEKIILINPPTTDPGESTIYFPMALLTLGGVLKKLNVTTELWDFDLYFKNVRNTTETQFRKLLLAGVDGSRARVFGISSICSNLPMALWIAREIKRHKRQSIILLGGPQPSSVPLQLLERFDFIDLIAVGEGEKTLEDLVQAGFDKHKIPEIPGVGYRHDGVAKLTAHRALVPNMDELPYPDYSLIRFSDYSAHHLSTYVAHVEVGRGCPYSCTFCSTALMWEKDFRVKSPRRILDEMEFLNKEYGFKEFGFIHDNFTTSKKFVDEFCQFMEKENTRKLRWAASSRTDCLTIERLERMHRVGLSGLFYGIETGSPRMQKIIKKGLQLENFEPILKRANELGICSTTAFILGFPEETKDDIDQTLWRALHYRGLGTEKIFFSKLTALTGTALYDNNLDKFTEFSRPSTISPQNYGLPFVTEIIRKYPDLFASYYHIPHPTLSSEYLAKLVEFSHLLINGDPKLSLMIIENVHLGGTRLFEMWDDWAMERKVPYWLYRIYTLGDFKRDFQTFLDEKLFSQIKVDLGRSTIAARAA
ncbi:MAG TPA: radical SAM protein [bacterium]|nr:radical SAM protein [bacterium]